MPLARAAALHPSLSASNKVEEDKARSYEGKLPHYPHLEISTHCFASVGSRHPTTPALVPP